MNRCSWLNLDNELYVKYHDEEWCKKKTDNIVLFECLVLEMFQAGLSFECVLNKRESFRKSFDNFDYNKIINYDHKKIEELLNNKNIIRHKLKIEAVINNAKIYKSIINEYGSFYDYLITLENKDESIMVKNLTKDLKNKKMKFVGETIIESYLEAIGIFNHHEKNCDFK